MGCVFGRRDEDRSVSCTLVAFVMEALRFLFWRYVATVVTELTCVNEICVCVCVFCRVPFDTICTKKKIRG